MLNPKKSWTYNDLLSCHAKGYGTTNSERDGIACLSSRTIRLQKNSRTEELENSFDISAIVLAWDLKISKECHSWFQKKISNLMRRRNFRRLWLKSYPAKKRLIVPKSTGFKIFLEEENFIFKQRCDQKKIEVQVKIKCWWDTGQTLTRFFKR